MDVIKDFKVMVYPPQSYLLLAGDLHQKMILIKHGICIEVDVLGNITLRGPGDTLNLISTITKFQSSTFISLTHVYCYEMGRQFIEETSKKGSIIDIQNHFPSFKIIIERILYNIFHLSNLDDHRIKTSLGNLEAFFTFDITVGQPCHHETSKLRLFMFSNQVKSYGNVHLLWNSFVVILLVITSFLTMQICVSLSHTCLLVKIVAVMDTFLLLDCYIRFQTPFLDDSGHFVTDLGMIAKRWLKKYALSDFIYFFPMDLIAYFPWKLKWVDDDLGRKAISYIRFLKIFRFVRAYQTTTALGSIHPKWKKQLQIFINILCLLALISTCGSIWIGLSCKPGTLTIRFRFFHQNN